MRALYVLLNHKLTHADHSAQNYEFDFSPPLAHYRNTLTPPARTHTHTRTSNYARVRNICTLRHHQLHKHEMQLYVIVQQASTHWLIGHWRRWWQLNCTQYVAVEAVSGRPLTISGRSAIPYKSVRQSNLLSLRERASNAHSRAWLDTLMKSLAAFFFGSDADVSARLSAGVCVRKSSSL